MGEDSSKLLEGLMGMLGDNPSETLGQMISALTGGEKREEAAQQPEAEKEPEQPDTTEKAATGIGLDPSMFLKLQSLMGQLGDHEADERSALLAAIRPFLNAERQAHVDQAIKLLKLSKLAKTAQDMDLFNGLL